MLHSGSSDFTISCGILCCELIPHPLNTSVRACCFWRKMLFFSISKAFCSTIASTARCLAAIATFALWERTWSLTSSLISSLAFTFFQFPNWGAFFNQACWLRLSTFTGSNVQVKQNCPHLTHIHKWVLFGDTRKFLKYGFHFKTNWNFFSLPQPSITNAHPAETFIGLKLCTVWQLNMSIL